MSKIGHGYGSEWHFLRFLGYHRDYLNRKVCEVVGGAATAIEWLDFPFDPARPLLDAEWKNLDFLLADHSVQPLWRAYWPQTGNVPNWDAVGKLRIDGRDEWLLIEAKGHLGEIKSTCGASERGGLPTIRKAFGQAKIAFGADASADWLSPYYQYANRLAVLSFLNGHDIPARMLFVYFLDDRNPSATCPSSQEQWDCELEAMYGHLGLKMTAPIASRVHRLFLPVCPQQETAAVK